MIYMTYSLIHAEVWENRISYLFMRSILNRKLQLSNVIISNFRQRIQLKFIQLHKENMAFKTMNLQALNQIDLVHPQSWY